MNNIYDSSFYIDVKEAQEIKNIQVFFEELLKAEVSKLKKNQFILTSDEGTTTERETEFNILADIFHEDLELRRKRVLMRNSAKLPYTFRYLKERLDEIAGKGKYILKRDISKREIVVEMSAESAFLFTEISLFINKIKPANMVYINSPYIAKSIKISEEIKAIILEYNYRLGTSFILGKSPFLSEKEEETVKMADIQSIKKEYLIKLAASSIEAVKSVRINSEIIIENLTKTQKENAGTVAYIVAPEEITEIRKVELLSSDSKVLASSDIYVPVAEVVKIKHTLMLKEGEA